MVRPPGRSWARLAADGRGWRHLPGFAAVSVRDHDFAAHLATPKSWSRQGSGAAETWSWARCTP